MTHLPMSAGYRHADISCHHVVPGPAPKRQTLVDRAGDKAGESRIVAPTPTSSRMASAGVKATTLVGARNPNFSSSTSSRDPSVPGRNPLGRSIGHGNRPPTAQSKYRPQSSIGHNRAPRPATTPHMRPASSMEVDRSENDKSAAGKRDGMTALSFSTSGRFPRRLSERPAAALDSYKHIAHVQSERPVLAVRTAPHANPSNQPKSIRDLSLCTAMRSLTLQSCSRAGGDEDVDPSSSPTRMPRVLPVQTTTPSSCRLPPKTPRSSKHSASPKKLPFLTRETRLQAWDTNSRLADMELLYSELKDKMNGSTAERTGLQEALDIYKTRSKRPPTVSGMKTTH